MYRLRDFTLRDSEKPLEQRELEAKIANKIKSILKIKPADRTEWDKEDIKRYRKFLNVTRSYYQLIHNKSSESSFFYVKNDKKPPELLVKQECEKLVRLIQAKRHKTRKTKSETLDFYGARTNQKQGHVFLTGGAILSLHKNNHKNSPLHEKKPVRNDINYIGIELEFNAKNTSREASEREEIAAAIKEANLGRFCNITRDSSCGHELRVLLPENNYAKILYKICRLLKTMGYKVDARCGTHVHFDMRNRDYKKCYENLFKMQDLMYKMVKKTRTLNDYCKRNTYETVDKWLEHGGTDRYSAINIDSYLRHKTIEVRLHHGTLESKELSNWIRMLLKVINYTDKIVEDIKDLDTLKKIIPLNPNEFNKLTKRYEMIQKASD